MTQGSSTSVDRSAPPREAPSPSASPTGAVPLPPENQKLLDAYRAQARNGRDPLASNLALTNAQLIEIHHRLGQFVNQHLARPGFQLEDVHDISPELDQLLRFSRQVERFGQLEHQIRRSNERKRDPMLAGAPNTPFNFREDPAI